MFHHKMKCPVFCTFILQRDAIIQYARFYPTVLTVALMLQCCVRLSSVCLSSVTELVIGRVHPWVGLGWVKDRGSPHPIHVYWWCIQTEYQPVHHFISGWTRFFLYIFIMKSYNVQIKNS